jgi:hypothetical protein
MVLHRAAVALAAALATTSAAAAALAATPEPTRPPACNATMDTNPPVVQADAQFAADNGACWHKFAECLVNWKPDCSASCDAGRDDLSNTCYAAGATFCSVSGVNADPTTGVPLYAVTTNDCVVCDSGSLGDLTAYWRHTLCGAAYWQNASVCTVGVACDWDMPESQLWLIVGSVAGAAGFVLVLCAAAYCRMRHKQMLEDEAADDEDALFDELGDGTSSASSAAAAAAAGGGALGYSFGYGRTGDAPLLGGGSADPPAGGAGGGAEEDPAPYAFTYATR